VKNIVQ